MFGNPIASHSGGRFVPLCALAALLLGRSEPALAQCSGTSFSIICEPGTYSSNITTGAHPTR
jgi:hypothetical protein